MRSLDVSLFYLLNDFAGQSGFADSVIVFCASYLAYIVGALFVVFLYVTRRSWRQKVEIFSVALAGMILARGAITEIIRHFYHRPRPFSVLPVHKLLDDSAWSFPSGHATFFFALATAVYLYDRRWGTWFFLLSMLITLARVAAGVHYPSDILGGAIIGVFSGYFAYLCMYRYLTRNTHQTY
jgi:undecaprenyl-diphosphatase